MLLVQAGATAAAVQAQYWPAKIGSAVLILSATLSGISGFFDGQLARPDLGAGFVVAQFSYVVVAGLAAACGIGRLATTRRVDA